MSVTANTISNGQGTAVGGETTRKTVIVPVPPSPIPGVILEGELGRGGQGIVYKGHQTYLDRPVAVKLLLVQGAEGLEFVRRFQREAKILASLAHPNIVTCYQAGLTAASNPYLVMEFIDGLTLKDWIERHGRMPARQAIALARDLARALDHAHEKGIIHLDVKPENVLLARRADATADDPFPFAVKLVDLGLARPSANAGSNMASPGPGAAMGRFATMAPEQFDDPDHLDYRADIYGLGCVLYHALVGRPAFADQSLGKIVTIKISGEVPQVTRAKADLPLAINELVCALLARLRDARPQSYREIIERCDQLLGADARPLGRQGNRAAWIGVVAAVVILGGVALVLDAMHQKPAAPAHVPPTPIATKTPTAQPIPLNAIRDADWNAPIPLWQIDRAQRLSGWTSLPNAQWASSETRNDTIAGIAGRITRALERLPCRVEGVLHHASESDKAQIGVRLADGASVDLTVLNLGPITHAVLNSYKNGDTIPSSSQGPVTLPWSKAVPFTLVVRHDSFVAAVDGNPFAALPLSAAPLELYLGAEGRAPVEFSALTIRRLK